MVSALPAPRSTTARAPSIALCILSHQRPGEVVAALASVRDQGFDEILVLDNASTPPLPEFAGARRLRSDVNLGVSGGHNLLAREANSDVLLILDDDAVVRPGVADLVREAFAADPGLGGMALRIERPGGEVLTLEQPFARGRRPAPDRPVACAYFIGAGHAVRRSAYLAVGGGDERMFYGSDEIEAAFRLLHAGWSLRYDPRAVVEHRPAPTGRMPDVRRIGHHLHNRVILARRYLPLPLQVVHILAWAVMTGLRARRAGGLGVWWRELGRGLREPVDRRRLSPRRLWEIHRLGGRILY